jgi:succinate-semialdehyde dehydrogenase/glutarate-semialdehyde dehydrogenase
MQPTYWLILNVAYLLLRKNYWPSSLFYKVENEQEAIDSAKWLFGLGGSIFTKDIKRAMQVADQIDMYDFH